MIDRIYWLGHGSFHIDGPLNIYINPWKLPRQNTPADVILVTHHHYEHFSPADITQLRAPHTTVITNTLVATELDGATVLRPWHSINLGRVNIKAVPAYSPTSLYHPETDGGLGFIVSMSFYDIYYAGDTQIIPEMARIHPDIAILPIDGNGTLTVEEAAQATDILNPRWVIPSNWGKQSGGATPLDVLHLRDLVGNRAEVIAPVKRNRA